MLLLLVTAAYAVAYLLWFWGTPLGEVPVLDGRENIALARQIADGSLPSEPFFRAMLYPALLSLFARSGTSDSDLLMIAGTLGVLFHILATAALFRCSLLIWHRRAPAILSALLFGFYPIATYFAAEPLDTTFSLSLAIIAIWLGLSSAEPSRSGQLSIWKLIACGLLLSLAFLARPNFLPLIVAMPIAAVVLANGATRRVLAPSLIVAGMLPPILLYAGWQRSVSGHFGIMPWQGGYSLWVANGPEANGRYYAQKSAVSYEGSHQNPARVESESLYRAETGSPSSPLENDRFWRAKTKAAVIADPSRWLGLEVQKLYFFLNDFEQYNNKTFSFHKAESPLLRWNPLSWGVVFSLAVIGLFAAWQTDWRKPAALLILASAYFAGGLLVFAGDRFRFPLAPFAALFGGGVLFVFTSGWRQWSLTRKIMCAVSAVLALAIAFSRFLGVHDESTYVQDRILLANASLRAGHDAEARAYAAEVLKSHPDRSDARHIAATARCNQHLDGTLPLNGEAEWRALADQLDGASATLPGTKWTQAVANWNAGRKDAAIQQLRELANSGQPRIGADSLAMLVLVEQATESERAALQARDWRQQSPYVWMALAKLGGERFEQQIVPAISAEKWAQVRATENRLFPNPPSP